MKKSLLLLLGAFLFLSLPAQKQVEIRFTQKAGNADFAMNTAFGSDAGYDYKATRLQYYLCLPSIIHDGGQVTQANSRYFLVDASNEVTLNLGELEVDNIEGIIFSIGVDEARNHLDPTDYPAGHPLAPQNPSMHWGWVAGYRFIAYEGKAGNNFLYNFDIHSIGDDLFKTVTLYGGAQEEDGKLVIPIQADYNKLLHNIDVSGGLSAHGNLGPAGDIMDNIQNLVFSTLITSSVKEKAGFAGSFILAPNPATEGYSQAIFDLPYACQLIVSDLTGRQVSLQNLPEGRSAAQLNAPGPGLYLAQLWHEGRPVAAKKWAVTR